MIAPRCPRLIHTVDSNSGGRNSSVLRDVASRIPPFSEPPVDAIFPLELTWVLTPFSKTLSDKSINRVLVCAHMNSVARIQKTLSFMSCTGECRQQKTHPACTILEDGM